MTKAKIFTTLATVFIISVSKPVLAGGDVSSPLATWDTSGSTTFLASSTLPGTLTVTDTCVWLEFSDTTDKLLLVWPEPTSWNAETGEITAVDYQGDTTVLKAGDVMTAGGAAATSNAPYVIAPDPACEAKMVWLVNEVVLE